MAEERALTKAEALDELWKIGSHTMITVEHANRIGQPFGLTFEAVDFKYDPRDPKGPLEDFTGVDVHHMAAWICDRLGLDERPRYNGRGSQFRSDLELAMKVVKE